MFQIRHIRKQLIVTMASRNLADYEEFGNLLRESRRLVVITGAGISAESGIPVFQGTGGLWRGGLWRTHNITNLGTPEAFQGNPALVWEFCHWRRTVAFAASPNSAHIALAKFEKEFRMNGRRFTILTQNVDGLHQRAGSQNVIELHGTLRKVMCTKCKIVVENVDNPICKAFKDRGDPDSVEEELPEILLKDLPKCKSCGHLVRPYIVWYGENIQPALLEKSKELIRTCDLCMVVGTSSTVYPAGMFGSQVAEEGTPVAEFNLNDKPHDPAFRFYFKGPCGTTLPKALGIEMGECSTSSQQN